MEDVLTLYQRPEDVRFPVVNMDEQPVQLLAEKRVPLPMAPGRVRRVDPEYVRQGTAIATRWQEGLTGDLPHKTHAFNSKDYTPKLKLDRTLGV